MNAGEREGLREVLAAISVRHQRIPLYAGSFGAMRCVGCDHLKGATDGPNSPRHAEHVAAEQATAVLDWLRVRLASDEVREAVDAAIEGARDSWFTDGELPSEYRPYTDAALTAVLAALEVER